MVVTTLLGPTCDNYKAKSAFWGTFDPNVTLTLHLIPKFDMFILAPKTVRAESVVKFHQQIHDILLTIFVRDSGTREHTHTCKNTMET